MRLIKMDYRSTSLFSIRDYNLGIFVESEDALKIETLRRNLNFYKLVTWALQNTDETIKVEFSDTLLPKTVITTKRNFLITGEYFECHTKYYESQEFSLDDFKVKLINFCDNVREAYTSISKNGEISCIKKLADKARENYELSEELRKYIEDYEKTINRKESKNRVYR